jgi:amino acid adenylation domain-containing protein
VSAVSAVSSSGAVRLAHQPLVELARRAPWRIAAQGRDGQLLDYGELERRSRALAHRLRALGGGPEVPIGVCAHRSLDAVVAVFGILRAGAAYVPLDPEYPRQRLAMMIADSGITTALVEPGAHAALPSELRTLDLAAATAGVAADGGGGAPLDETALPDNLAYVMYTSGSTGAPKGVMISHAAICNTLGWMQEAYPLEEDDVVAHKTSISFTDSIWELLWPQLAGARLAVIEEEEARFPRRLVAALARSGAAVTQFVPAQMRLFLDEVGRSADPHPLPALRLVWNGGEALPPALARDWFERFPATRIANAYGMTESAIYGTNFAVEPAQGEPRVRIGAPIRNERAYVLDGDGQACAPPAIGELHLAGLSLSRGYLGRPELTAERFVPDPFGPPGARMYRTGDLGRLADDGELECLGRLDRQVKVHGARVELGEVEAALGRHPAIRQAVVLARRDGEDHRLTAYYACRDADPGARELRRFLAEKLPAYMVPSALIAVAAFPLTVNGKIDRGRLEREATAHL